MKADHKPCWTSSWLKHPCRSVPASWMPVAGNFISKHDDICMSVVQTLKGFWVCKLATPVCKLPSHNFPTNNFKPPLPCAGTHHQTKCYKRLWQSTWKTLMAHNAGSLKKRGNVRLFPNPKVDLKQSFMDHQQNSCLRSKKIIIMPQIPHPHPKWPSQGAPGSPTVIFRRGSFRGMMLKKSRVSFVKRYLKTHSGLRPDRSFWEVRGLQA